MDMKNKQAEMLIFRIANIIDKAGGELFLVGGAVRDNQLGVEVTDHDFLVVGIEETIARKIVSTVGTVKEASIISNAPVFAARIAGEWFEFAMGRKEIKTGEGMSSFEFVSTPDVTLEDDLIRRDFTCNAMAEKVLTGRVFDPFDGQASIRCGILTHISDHFVESPERVIRGCVASARFDMPIAGNTLELMKEMKSEFHTIPVEQLWLHFEKFAKKAIAPEMFLISLISCEWVEFFPEIRWAEAFDALMAVDVFSEHKEHKIMAGLIAGMPAHDEVSFFDRINAPKKVRKFAVEFKHFGTFRPKQWVFGRDIAHLVEPGEEMGKLVRWAFIGQINNLFESKEDVIKWIEGVI